MKGNNHLPRLTNDLIANKWFQINLTKESSSCQGYNAITEHLSTDNGRKYLERHEYVRGWEVKWYHTDNMVRCRIKLWGTDKDTNDDDDDDDGNANAQENDSDNAVDDEDDGIDDDNNFMMG